jgi:hypothetical protein
MQLPSPTEFPPLPPPPQTVPYKFQLEFYIQTQANQAYNNPESQEYQQAVQIVRRAVRNIYYYM